MTFIRTTPTGISAVVLRRGGRLVAVSVPEMIREAKRRVKRRARKTSMTWVIE